MEISSSFAGTRLKPFTTRVDARATMNYAAAINDNNPCYFDNRRGDDGLMVHPLNPVAITWNILGKIWEFIEADDFPLEALLTQIHHTETIVYHRALVPGDTLTIDGLIAAIEPHRAGTRVVIRFDAADDKHRPVFSEYCGALLRGVTCADSGRRVGDLPATPTPENPTGSIWNAAIDIAPLMPYIYDGCTDIVFPIHTSPKFAKEVGLPGIILQGTATLALAISAIVDHEAAQRPDSIRALSGRFTGMVLPGTRIEIRLTERRDIPEGTALFFEVRDTAGKKAVSDGYAEVASTP